MSEEKKQRKGFDWKKELRSWAIILGIFGVLYATGLHTEVIGRIQQAVLWTGLFQPEMNEPAPGAGRAEANWDYRLQRLDGQPVNLSDYRGKVVFLNFWATWCPPCVAEMPGIHDLYQSVKDDDDIVFLMVSLDEKADKAQKFVDDKGFTFPIYRPLQRRPGQLQSQTIPTTFVLNPQGWVVMEHQGMAKYNTDDFRSFLKKLKSQSDASAPENIGQSLSNHSTE